jgi:hypothetical protein
MAYHSRLVYVQFCVYKDEGPLSKITGIKIPGPPIYHEKEALVLPPNHTPKPVDQYDYSTVKHFGGYDVHGAVKGAAQVAAAKTKVAMKKMNIPDTDQHYANGHLVYSKNYANYV